MVKAPNATNKKMQLTKSAQIKNRTFTRNSDGGISDTFISINRNTSFLCESEILNGKLVLRRRLISGLVCNTVISTLSVKDCAVVKLYRFSMNTHCRK